MSTLDRLKVPLDAALSLLLVVWSALRGRAPRAAGSATGTALGTGTGVSSASVACEEDDDNSSKQGADIKPDLQQNKSA